MVQFKAFDSRVEVNGESILSVVSGLGGKRKGVLNFSSAAYRILEENGIPDPKPGTWYPQQNWLNAFRHISEKTGSSTLRMIGRSIPENARWIQVSSSMEEALRSIDIAYHINHRIEGKILYSPSTGQMREGIGHYKYEPGEGEGEHKLVCDTPYPCSFDIGIIEATAEKFSGSVFVKHESDKCRRNPEERSCLYIIT